MYIDCFRFFAASTASFKTHLYDPSSTHRQIQKDPYLREPAKFSLSRNGSVNDHRHLIVICAFSLTNFMCLVLFQPAGPT